MGITGNAWKWLEIVGKGCMRAIYGSNWLICLEMAENGLETDGNGWKSLEMAWPENVLLNTTVMCRVM